MVIDDSCVKIWGKGRRENVEQAAAAAADAFQEKYLQFFATFKPRIILNI